MKPKELSNQEVSDAIRIAVNYHSAQSRWDGTPYILHPLRVMSKMTTNFERVIAVLHDVVEDTEASLQLLLSSGVDSEAVDLVNILTRKDDETNEVYLMGIECSDVATKVKIEDLLDNLNLHSLPPSETGVIKEKDVLRLNRYMAALKQLGYQN